jgi:hypothetical protein
MKKTAVALAALALTATTMAAPASAAGHKPDTACMQAGIAVLKDAGLFSTVAATGLPVSLATSPAVGVTVRPGMESVAAGLPESIPLSVVLADHRAGDSSILLYPWC